MRARVRHLDLPLLIPILLLVAAAYWLQLQ
jgi:hypothetical protein